jgi:exodeoxyribonuclease V gamma subunit
MLTIHRAERADRLVRALGDVLAVPPRDPFEPDVVAVPSRGVERWISQSLAGLLGAPAGDGICANVRFPSPATLVADALACATGLDPADDPWSAPRLPWAVLEVIDDCGAEEWCRTLGTHLGLAGEGDVEHRRGRRVAVAQKLARLFASYAAQRPELVLGWLDAHGDDSSAGRLDPDLRWQAELYRRVRDRLAVPSPAERVGPACAAIRAGSSVVDLPGRVSVFGPTRLTADQLEVLDALAEHRDLHLWLPHPSPALWERVERLEPETLGSCR